MHHNFYVNNLKKWQWRKKKNTHEFALLLGSPSYTKIMEEKYYFVPNMRVLFFLSSSVFIQSCIERVHVRNSAWNNSTPYYNARGTCFDSVQLPAFIKGSELKVQEIIVLTINKKNYNMCYMSYTALFHFS